MTTRRTWAIAALSAALLMACGGGDPDVAGSVTPNGGPKVAPQGGFTSLVTFGDSLSDLGTYTPATSVTANGQPPFIGGKFTTNVTDSAGSTSKIWVENLATTLGLVVTPAEVGFNSQSVACPAAANPLAANTCTAYGQGGSRVSDINGIGHSTGALTVPVTTQVARHLTRFTSFKSTDLVIVWAGANDVLIQFQGFGAKAAQITAQRVANAITTDQANGLLLNAQLEAQAALKIEALKLSEVVKSQIVANGGRYVAIVNIPDIGSAPLASAPAVAPAKTVLTGLSQVFNLWLREGLKDQPVQWIDAADLFARVIADKTAFGFTNVTASACDIDKIKLLTLNQVQDGSSLFCNSSATLLNGLSTAANDDNAATNWLFADSIHPTTGGHKAISDAFTTKLRGFGWIQ